MLVQCATLSENQCREGDWKSIGLQDGVKGFDKDRVVKHAKACQEYGVVADAEQYERGRREGLEVYCVPENGYSMGKQGKVYERVCPVQLEPAFLKYYQLGREFHEAEQKIMRIHEQTTELQARLDVEKESHERDVLRKKISVLSQQRVELERRLTVLEIKAEVLKK